MERNCMIADDRRGFVGFCRIVKDKQLDLDVVSIREVAVQNVGMQRVLFCSSYFA